MRKPCVFFDRDGIVNEPPIAARYVRNVCEFHMNPEFIDVLRIVRRRGYEAVVVTNQKGVATGVMSQADVDAIHEKMLREVERAGLRLTDVIVCTAADDADPRRKPNPGMLFEAAERHQLDLSRSWMIGDNPKDIEAGRRAGCRTILVSPEELPVSADFRVQHLNELPALLNRILPDASEI